MMAAGGGGKPAGAPPLVLVVDDDRAHRLMLTTLIGEWGYRTEEAEDGRKAVERVRRAPVDLILMDMRMPDMDGIEATKAVNGVNPAIPIVIMTAYSSVPSAVEALKSGASDYLTKPLDFDALRIVLERALEHTRLREENETLRVQLAGFQSGEMVGESPAARRVLEMVSLVAPTEATVLITGESGVGKSLIARLIHANSPRRERPLVEVNCAAIPENLMESELFGHEKGAFTGADRQRKGRFAMAHQGTIFLDEIGDLAPPMQAKLLRVLQEGEVQRVGSDMALPVDVRVVAATNRDLRKLVTDKVFREDLYYRLNVFTIEAPPLRERTEDIPALAAHFLARFAAKNHKTVRGITPRGMDLLIHYEWPGNIRELENAMERAVILLRGEFVTERELPLVVQCARGEEEEEEAGLPQAAEESAAASALEADTGGTLADLEKRSILHMLEETGGNKSEAARRLGITRRTLKLKLKKYEEEESGGE